MNINNKPNSDIGLKRLAQLRIKAMNMVAEEYGNTLSHEEFMDKVEALFCELLEEAAGVVEA